MTSPAPEHCPDGYVKTCTGICPWHGQYAQKKIWKYAKNNSISLFLKGSARKLQLIPAAVLTRLHPKSPLRSRCMGSSLSLHAPLIGSDNQGAEFCGAVFFFTGGFSRFCTLLRRKRRLLHGSPWSVWWRRKDPGLRNRD